MNQAVQQYLLQLKKPQQEAFWFLQQVVLQFHANITLEYKWKTPYFYFKGKPLCYFTVSAKKETYLGFAKGHLIKHAALEQGDRSMVKIYRLETHTNLNTIELKELLHLALEHY